jgi:hypothetical protein
MRTYAKRVARRLYTEPPVPAPAPSIPLAALVSAFTTEIASLHEQRNTAQADGAQWRRSHRLSRIALDNVTERLHRMREAAREQGQREDDERDPVWFYDAELVTFRGALMRIADTMGVQHTYGMDNLLTSDQASALASNILDRWQETVADAQRWKARSLHAEQDAEHYRPRAKAGD